MMLDLRSSLYQIRHPFHWLTYGQNASGVQAGAAVVATAAAIVAGYFAARAYFATVAQLGIAKGQLDLAKEQFKTEQRRFLEEQESNRRATLARYERTKSEEDSVRPRFQTGAFSRSPAYNLGFRNIGGSPATNVEFSYIDDAVPFRRIDLISPNMEVVITTNVPRMESEGIQIRFSTSYGSRWTITQGINQPQNEMVLSVVRPYTPEEVDTTQIAHTNSEPA